MVSKEVEVFLKGIHTAFLDLKDLVTNLGFEGGEEDRVSLLEVLDDASVGLERLETGLCSAALFLPPYELRVCKQEIAGLKLLYRQKREELFPRRRFRFRNRALVNQNAPDLDETLKLEEKREEDSTEYKALCFEDKNGEDLVLESVAGKDIVLRRLSQCTVQIHGVPSAVTLSHLESCTLQTSPISGSLHVTACTNCTIASAARQIRIHDTFHCDLYLHVPSGAIIENSKQIRVAPYNLGGDDIEKQFKEAQLDASNNQWDSITDFNWLRIQQSPNWSILPKEQRTRQTTRTHPIHSHPNPPASFT